MLKSGTQFTKQRHIKIVKLIQMQFHEKKLPPNCVKKGKY